MDVSCFLVVPRTGLEPVYVDLESIALPVELSGHNITDPRTW